MARQHRSHSVAFKRQVAEEFLAGETLHGLAKSYLIGEATNTLIDYAFPCLQTSTFMKKVSAGLCG
jgi:hypothetical protein